ncbi:MAG: preprotein translocase subunit SecA [Parcubacteria group bacterium Athens1014_10]|nr:MAG: preprotein translocase subunit SecA [Parcubacteria group bacterium Athens1014_10]TSD05963.1 MAG: preprotein translocase subunit SecA [Parcubacteria group bacterium Athens0714_12]
MFNFFGDPNKKFLNKLQPTIDKINQLEERFQSFSLEKLKGQTDKFKERLVKGETLEDLLPEAFTVVKEVSKRALKMRHFDVQLLGGISLHQGKIVEMKTGEGKTLVATLPLYLNALTGKGCHLVTVNDYLARRDVEWMGKIYYLLGLKTSVLNHEKSYLYEPKANGRETDLGSGEELREVLRKEAYQADILYGTNNEFGFDYLRDNMVYDSEEMAQRPLNFAIIDEVDSILIDEARTPLIISAPAEESADLYYKFAELIKHLKENDPSTSSGQGDYNIDEKMRSATLTEEGINKIEKWLNMGNIYTEGGLQMVHHLEQALKAQTLFKKDKDYVVKEGEIIIIDEFTGRLMNGRRYSEGLHQAIEAKERVQIKRESVTLASITFQNYFRMYQKLAGMTGTAVTNAEEFHKVYNLDVIVAPTNKPLVRKVLSDRIYKNEMGKLKAVAEEVKNLHQKGQPVLIGTISIEKNELISELLEREGVTHQLLNAKYHEREAQILSQAGRLGAVTVATNMAGRGVDIILGGSPADSVEQEKVKKLGGLHVLGTERHEARRIDDQLRGRAGRQGDPGSSQFYVSMEDDLMRVFGSERMKNIMERLGVPDDMPIENKLISRSIETAQNKVEGYNFDLRKHLLEYDDVMNKHRQTIYKKRKEILGLSKAASRGLRKKILEMVENEIEQVILFHTAGETKETWNLEEIYEVVNTIFPLRQNDRIKLGELRNGNKSEAMESRTKIIEYLAALAAKAYDKLEEKIADENLVHQLEKAIVLRTIDTLWIEHLEQMDYLRTGIGLRGYAQRDPLVEYKEEAYKSFTQLINMINSQVVYSIYKVGLAREIAPSAMQRTARMRIMAPAKTMEKGKGEFTEFKNGKSPMEGQGYEESIVSEKVRDQSGHKIGRNDPCPCGSRKKYKKCCGK